MSSVLLHQQVRKRIPLTLIFRRKSIFLVLIGLILLILPLFITDPAHLFAGNGKRSITLPDDPHFERYILDHLLTEKIDENNQGSLSTAVVESLRIQTYQIRQGDTLSTIAQRFGRNLDTIISYNDIKDARRLPVGKDLDIPNEDGLKYRVRRGDSLFAIAQRYDIHINDLVDWNSLTSEVIRPGQEFFIVGARMSENSLKAVLGKLFIYPAGGRLTSPYGYRSEPFTGVRQFHYGIDIGNNIGTPIAATMSGKVVDVGFNSRFGKYIILSHPDSFQTLYGHLSRVLVQENNAVKQGGMIGEMGSTGYSTGSHLHFTIWKDGTPVDPLKYLH